MNRYHLYVSYACPWAHRTLMTRHIKGLQKVISVSIVDPVFTEFGWGFSKDYPDDLYSKSYLKEIYELDNPSYEGRYTVPILWDKETKKIVSKESEDIVRFLNSEFPQFSNNEIDLYPEALQQQIRDINAWILSDINAGVYKAGLLPTTQEQYEVAVKTLFSSLEKVDLILENQRYLLGNQITEADIRLFATLFRFDSVYYIHFKCSLKKIEEFKNLPRFMRDIYQTLDLKSTCNMDHVMKHYYLSHKQVNPKALIPLVKFPDLDTPHGRELMFSKTEEMKN